MGNLKGLVQLPDKKWVIMPVLKTASFLTSFSNHCCPNFSMIYRSLIFFLICVTYLGLASAAFAGAWTQKKGGYYFMVGVSYLNSTKDIDVNGKQIQKANMGELRDINYSTYLEYGLLDRLTLVSSVPYKQLKDTRTLRDLNEVITGKALERRWGFGDMEMRLRWLLANKPVVASIAVGGKIPLWYDDDPNTRVPLSSKKVDADVRLLLGQSLYPLPIYVTGEVGYRIRGGDVSNEGFYALEAGITVDRFLFKGYLSGIHSFGTCNPVEEVRLIGDQSVLKLSPGIIYRLTDWLELSVEMIHIAAGCNTSAGNTFLFGIAFKR